jgi:hypothetical protein
MASLVLLKENILPHTFLHYIFLKKEAYDTENIAEELYTHELAHVQQKHTLDIILIELLQIVFWFNPLLIYYKKAMQLNHEFLADDAVIKSNIQIPAYQHLLLENSQGNQSLRLASNLNFSVTKKRLQMMTKHTTRGRAWFIATLTLPIFIAALFLFSTKVIAQEMTAEIEEIPAIETTTEQNDPKAEYYKNATFVFEDAQGNKIVKKYSKLTATEKARLVPPPNVPSAKKPTKQQLKDWQDPTKFAVWIDGKVTDNSEIANHNIVHFTQSFVYKNARSERFPQSYQTSLYTKAGFEAMKRKFKVSLGENAVIYIKEGDNQIRMSTKKVGATETPSAQSELAKANPTPENFVNENNGPNEVEILFEKAFQQPDIIILINKNNKFLVNENYVVPSLEKLGKVIESELAKIKHKNPKTASIVHDVVVPKEIVSKTAAILQEYKVYRIKTRKSNSSDEIVLPPPPPAPPAPKKIQIKEVVPPPPPPPKKPQIKEIKVKNSETPPPPPPPTDEEVKAISVMHNIIKGQNVETMMINGKKHYYVIKNGRKYIFNENSKMVDKNGKELPPPPPRAKKKVKEVKVKSKNKNKAKAKSKNKEKNKVKAKAKKEVTAENIKVIEVPLKSSKEKQ